MGTEPTRYLVLIKRDTDPWIVSPFRDRSEAVAFVASAGAQWSETYLVEVVAGPRDVVGKERSLARLGGPLAIEQAPRCECRFCDWAFCSTPCETCPAPEAFRARRTGKGLYAAPLHPAQQAPTCGCEVLDGLPVATGDDKFRAANQCPACSHPAHRKPCDWTAPAQQATGMEPVPAGWPCAQCGKNPKLENSAICGTCLEALLHPPEPQQGTPCGTCGGKGELLNFYARGPSDAPGNMMRPCLDCRGTGRSVPGEGR